MIGFSLVLVASVTASAGGDKDKSDGKNPARVLKVTVSIKAEGKATEPMHIKDAKKLADVFSVKEEQAAIAKEVDFTKESLVVFAWSGSGGDKVTPGGNDKEVKFTFVPGLTRDFRPHVHLFAIPKDAKLTVLKGGR
jgi:hypothetical protein